MKRNVIIGTVVLAALLVFGGPVPVASPQAGPKVLLLYDMEGVTGATNVRHTNFGDHPEYAVGRRSLTDDVNAAIAGLKAAGAGEIVVVDGHGSGNAQEPDVYEAELLAPAKMISRDRGFDIYMDSVDASFDAVVAIGMHAGAGNPSGFLSHTYSIPNVAYTVNGIPFNESMILAMGAARFGVPLIMLSGDDALEKEVRRFLPWVEYAMVKHAKGRSAAESLPREEASRRIEAAARKALLALDKARVPDITGPPFRFTLTFQDDTQARYAGMLHGAETLPGAPAAQFRADDFESGYRRSLDLISIAGLAGRLYATQAAIRAQPNAAAIQREASEVSTERWLNPPPAAPEVAGPPRRFFGAR
jgi:D-amino peptidase